MSTIAVTCQRRGINPGFLFALFAICGAGCLAVAVVQIVATAGPVLAGLGVAALVAWLVRVAPTVAVPVPLVACLAAVVAVSPWFLLGALLLLIRVRQ